MGKIALSGISFGILEADDLWQDVLSDFNNEPRSQSVYNCYVKYPQLAASTLIALKRSFSLAGGGGQVALMYLNSDKSEFLKCHENYLTCPV